MSDVKVEIMGLEQAAAEFERSAGEETAWTARRAIELKEKYSRDPVHQSKTVGQINELANVTARADWFASRRDSGNALATKLASIERIINAQEEAAGRMDVPAPSLNDAERDVLMRSDQVQVLEQRRLMLAMDQLRVSLEYRDLSPDDMLEELERTQAGGNRLVASYLDQRLERLLSRELPANEDPKRDMVKEQRLKMQHEERRATLASLRTARVTPEQRQRFADLRAEAQRKAAAALERAAKERIAAGDKSDKAISDLFNATRAKRLATQSA